VGVQTPSIESCIICRKHSEDFVVPGGVIYQDDRVYAGHAHIAEGQANTYLGWLVIETQRHIPGIADLSDQEGQAVGLLAARLSRVLKNITAAEHIYVFVMGHNVPHFHLHLLPRYPGTPREFWGLRVDEWPGAPHGGEAEIADLCDRLRAGLGTL
jgi:histidine triad (HIT) family protein